MSLHVQFTIIPLRFYQRSDTCLILDWSGAREIGILPNQITRPVMHLNECDNLSVQLYEFVMTLRNEPCAHTAFAAGEAGWVQYMLSFRSPSQFSQRDAEAFVPTQTPLRPTTRPRFEELPSQDPQTHPGDTSGSVSHNVSSSRGNERALTSTRIRAQFRRDAVPRMARTKAPPKTECFSSYVAHSYIASLFASLAFFLFL